MGRGRSESSKRLVAAAREILEEVQPCTVRGVAYRLFAAGLIESMETKETSRVSRNLKWAREEGIIPWEWIVDETRAAERAGTWKDPEAFAAAALRSFRRDRWESQQAFVEVWSEKGTVRGILAPVLELYGVTFRCFHGFNSATQVREIAMETRDKPLRALYVGDYDPSGLYMSNEDLPGRLAQYGAHVHSGGECLEVDFDADTCAELSRSQKWSPEHPIELQRIALLDDDCDGLPDFPAKRKDPRYKWYHRFVGTTRAWELDAMNPRDLRERVKNAITSYIDVAAWERTGLAEKAEQEALGLVLGRWPTSISKQVQEYGGEP